MKIWPDTFPKLLFTAVLHRHGDRTPSDPYPTDPYLNYSWPGGLGASTQLGVLQLYHLGLNILPRYETLKPWNGIYTQETVHAISSSLERTRMSAECMLASFWKPYECEGSLPIPWQPVPIEEIPAAIDNILYLSENCTKYDQMFNKLVDDPDPGSSISAFNQKYSDLYKYLSKYMGENVTSCQPASYLYDTLLVESDHGLTLPTWTQAVFPYPLHDCRVRGSQLATENEYMKLIQGGPFVTEVYNDMLLFLNGTSARNLYFYSGHETTIFGVLSAMHMEGQTDPLPDYGACLVFELYGTDRHQEISVLMVYYANTTVKVPQILEITGCPYPCYFTQFANVIQHLLISDYNKICQL